VVVGVLDGSPKQLRMIGSPAIRGHRLEFRVIKAQIAINRLCHHLICPVRTVTSPAGVVVDPLIALLAPYRHHRFFGTSLDGRLVDSLSYFPGNFPSKVASASPCSLVKLATPSVTLIPKLKSPICSHHIFTTSGIFKSRD